MWDYEERVAAVCESLYPDGQPKLTSLPPPSARIDPWDDSTVLIRTRASRACRNSGSGLKMPWRATRCPERGQWLLKVHGEGKVNSAKPRTVSVTSFLPALPLEDGDRKVNTLGRYLRVRGMLGP